MTNPDSQVGQPRYAKYALGVLVLVYIFNFIDRQILSILAEDIKADLGLSDATLGFLYGTAFAVFYAILGIPLARLADVWVRTRLIAIGLFFWSLMTALSGTAQSFTSLAALRIGVGVGESSANPAAYSLLGDYFPPRYRATVLSIYSSGIYIGIGLGMFLGGWIVEAWNTRFPSGSAPWGLAGWQVTFFVVGLPGVLVSLWVGTLREPARGAQENERDEVPSVNPFSFMGDELMSVIPPLTIYALYRAGAGVVGIVFNLMVAVVLALAAWLTIGWLRTPAQWISLALGGYCFASWLQGLSLKDPAMFRLVFRSRAMMTGTIGFGCIAFVAYGAGFWSPPFFMRVHQMHPGRAGTLLGLAAAVGGWLGVTSGGILSDRLKESLPFARPLVGILSAVTSLVAGIGFTFSPNVQLSYACFCVFQFASSAWIGPAVALSGELVPARMRATASAFYILMVTFLGLALGPYTVGQISDRLSIAGGDPGDALRSAICSSFLAYLPALVLLAVCSVSMPRNGRYREKL